MKVFCQICREKTERDEMKCVENKTAKTVTRKYYHHGKCYEQHLQEEEISQKESELWDTLCKFILAIHGKQEFPNSFPTQLRDLRNGTIRFVKGGKVIEKNKEGTPYDVLLEAYQLAEESIKKAIRTKSFFIEKQEFNYGLAVAKGKINVVHLKRKRKARLEEQTKREDAQLIVKPVINQNVEYKGTNTKSKNDISDFLDD